MFLPSVRGSRVASGVLCQCHGPHSVLTQVHREHCPPKRAHRLQLCEVRITQCANVPAMDHGDSFLDDNELCQLLRAPSYRPLPPGQQELDQALQSEVGLVTMAIGLLICTNGLGFKKKNREGAICRERETRVPLVAVGPEATSPF